MDENSPPWLDEDFLVSVLQGGEDIADEDSRVKVLSFSSETASVPFHSTNHIYRVRIEYEHGQSFGRKSTTLIVKIPIVRQLLNEITDKHIAGNEQRFYYNLLQKFENKLNSEFGPKTYFSPMSYALVSEDLLEDGYTMRDEVKQLDYFHCRKVFKTLAKFHASSVACYKDDPSIMDDFGEDVLWADGSVLRPWIESAVNTLLEIIDPMEECKLFADYLRNKLDRIWQSVVNISKPKKTGLNVLNHGDLWINNLLFKYNDTGAVVAVKFLDFQITKFASPALDLINFVWTSANEEVREDWQKDLYQLYLQTLNHNLELLGCEERLAAEELLEDLHLAKDWAALMICCALPVIMNTPEESLDLAELSSNDFETSRFKKIYCGDKFKSLFPTTIRQFTEFFIENDELS